MERISQAAIRYNGLIYTLARPNRHHNIIHFMASKGLGPECMSDQGFITDEGRFVDRTEGFEIALKAEQKMTREPDLLPMLFSEDLW